MDGTNMNHDVTLDIILSCPDLDPSSSMDSLQTHDSFTTPESPRPYSLSPDDSLEQTNTQEELAGNDLFTYDSLDTTLSWLSLDP